MSKRPSQIRGPVFDLMSHDFSEKRQRQLGKFRTAIYRRSLNKCLNWSTQQGNVSSNDAEQNAIRVKNKHFSAASAPHHIDKVRQKTREIRKKKSGYELNNLKENGIHSAKLTLSGQEPQSKSFKNPSQIPSKQSIGTSTCLYPNSKPLHDIFFVNVHINIRWT
jgi:hypothetical protein